MIVKGQSIRRACADLSIRETCYRYQAKQSSENERIAEWLMRVTEHQRNWGFGLSFLYLRNVKGLRLESQARVPYLSRAGAEPSDQAQEAATTRSAIAADDSCRQESSLVDGLHARCAWRRPQLPAVQCAGRLREGLAIEADLSLPSARVIRTLQQVIDWRGKPRVIRCDNGPEYISGTLLQWAAERQIRIEYIQPGKPQQNAYVERDNRTVRYDWLAQHIFASIDESPGGRDSLAMDVQQRTPQHGVGRVHTDAEVGDGCLVPPLLAAAKDGRITGSGNHSRQDDGR